MVRSHICFDLYQSRHIPVTFGNKLRHPTGPINMPESSLAAFTTILKNSRLGPPTSTAPSLFPSFSINFTEMQLFGEKRLRISWRQVSTQIALLRTFMNDIWSALILSWSCWRISGHVLFQAQREIHIILGFLCNCTKHFLLG